MKLSASINFFNGEELLLDCARSIRENVDHLSIVYQLISNFGNDMSDDALGALEEIQAEGIIDDLILYTPNFSLKASENEFRKRKLGFDCAKDKNCTHFLSLDADEFYDFDEFEAAKAYIEDNKIYSSTVGSYYYIQSPVFRSKNPDFTNVSFICDVEKVNFERDGFYPDDNVDPTRRFYSSPEHHHVFEHSAIMMHHMSGVRNQFTSKFKNTSSRQSGQLDAVLEKMKTEMEAWEFPKPLELPSGRVLEFIKLETPMINLSRDEDSVQIVKEAERSSKPVALICQIWFREYAGSEVVTLELAEEFKSRGYEVIIYTQISGGKILDEAQANGIEVLTPDNLDLLDEKLDKIQLVWMHHNSFPISWFSEGNRLEKLIARWVVFHMSPYEKLEYPVTIDFIEKNASFVLFNSQETFESLSPVYGELESDRKQIFPNPAPRQFASLASLSNQSDNLQDVLVVSNHLPEELIVAIESLREKGVNVTTIGIGQDLTQRVTPNLLNSYQVVVTIGKTVQYCLNTQTTVYVYDRFGGPGFLTQENFEESSQYNFSGRGFDKKTSEKIVEELLDWTPKNRQQQTRLAKETNGRFSLVNQIDHILKDSSAQPVAFSEKDLVSFMAAEARLRWLQDVKTMGILQSAIHDLNQHNHNLQAQNDELRTTIGELQQHANNLQTNINNLQTNINNLQSNISTLQEQNHNLESSIEDIYNSQSWRVTAPLRKISSKLK